MNLNKDVFELRTSTRSELFLFLGSDFTQSSIKSSFMRLQTLTNTNLEALWQIKRERGLLPVDVRCSISPFMSLLESLSNDYGDGNENGK